MHAAPPTPSSTPSRRPALGALVALLTAFVLTMARPASAQQAAPTRVGVVNVNAVRSKMVELKEFRDHVQAQQALIDQSRKGHDAQLQDMAHKLQSMKPESDAFSDMQVQIDEKKASFQVNDQLMQASLLREVNTRQKKIYDEIIAVTATVAKKHGIDLVLVNNDLQLPPNVQEMNPEQLNNLLGQKLLLYVSDKIDITDEVTIAMDANYKATAATPH